MNGELRLATAVSIHYSPITIHRYRALRIHFSELKSVPFALRGGNHGCQSLILNLVVVALLTCAASVFMCEPSSPAASSVKVCESLHPAPRATETMASRMVPMTRAKALQVVTR